MEPTETNDATWQRRASPAPEGVSFGEELRRERELRGIGLGEIAEATKVNRRFLEALERNDFDSLPGGLFTRGFIRAYASHIGADPDRMVNAYLFQVSRQGDGEPEAHSGPRLEPRKDGDVAESRGARRGPWLLLFAALLIATPIAVFVLQPELLRGTPEPSPAGAATVQETASPPGPRERVLEMVADVENRVQVTCDGEIRMDRTLVAGERATVRCAGTLRLDASSGGDLSLTLDGEALGAPGQRGSLLLGWELEPPS